ncbi:DUF58 domain-containing protein [Actinospongicola halichondriae]|uniref:DUF58 domain-containing protein n=1 Tax=Actinospongicola halichondriae TaxID=3236844 RepID=UPI003D4E93F6
MPIPTPRLAIAALVAAVAVAVVPGTFAARLLLVNGALLALVVIDWALAPRERSFEIERRLPKVITLGGTDEVTWRVRDLRGRSFRIAVADELAPSLRAGSRRFSGVVPARGVLTVSTSLAPTRRGRFEPTELVWRADGPLGLAARQGRVQRPATLRVYPRFRSREEAELRIDRARILEVGLRSAKGRGGGTEFDQLREYTVDDEFRRIDWSATARAGRPIVRTFRAERNQNVVVLFDNGRVMAGRVASDATEGVPRAEFAMDAALLITTVATRLGDRCGLLAFDRSVRAVVQPSHGRGQLGKVTDALYELEPSLVDSDYAGAFHHTLAHFRRRALIVLLTDLVEQAVGESLLPALPVLTRSHLILVGAIQDPRVREWAEAPVTDEESAYRQAAAARTLRSRARAAARLRAAGATVVDAPPERLAAMLGDAYLEMKASGRL